MGKNFLNLLSIVFLVTILLFHTSSSAEARKPLPSPTPTPSPLPSPSPSPSPTPLPQAAGDIGTFSSANQGQLPTTLSQNSTAMTTVGSSSYLYVIGGYNGSYQSTVYKSTLNSLTGDVGIFSSTSQAQLPKTLSQLTTQGVNIGSSSYLYIIGGYNGAAYQSSVYKATLDGLSGNVGSFSSTSQAQLPQTLSSHATTISTIGSSTYLYIFGGQNSSSALSTVYKATLDGVTGDIGVFTSTNQAQLPQSLNQHSVVKTTIGASTYTYLIGGTNSSGASVSTVYKSTINAVSGDMGTVSTTSQSQLPRTMSAQTTIVTTIGPSTYMYVLGGKSGISTYSTVYKSTLDANTGDVGIFSNISQAQLPQTISQHTALTATFGTSSYLYLLGGNNGVSNSSTVYKSTISN